jgi:hypothetical protein
MTAGEQLEQGDDRRCLREGDAEPPFYDFGLHLGHLAPYLRELKLHLVAQLGNSAIQIGFGGKP